VGDLVRSHVEAVPGAEPRRWPTLVRSTSVWTLVRRLETFSGAYCQAIAGCQAALAVSLLVCLRSASGVQGGGCGCSEERGECVDGHAGAEAVEHRRS
jgi:hypothetical protein